MGCCKREILCYVILASFLLLHLAESKKKNSLKKPNNNETNLFNFLRLVVYRLIYGFASMFGAQESISDFMGGILVPPGADDDDDDGNSDYKDYLDGGDDDDFDY